MSGDRLEKLAIEAEALRQPEMAKILRELAAADRRLDVLEQQFESINLRAALRHN